METAHKKARAVIVVLLVLTVALGAACVWLLTGDRAHRDHTAELRPGNGLFSWHDEVLDANEQTTLFHLMREQNLTELYQDVPRDAPVAQISAFAKACEENGVRLFLLVGEPEWALDENATELCAQIQRAALMGFAGVMVDVEPGSTDEWKEDRAAVMQTMTRSFVQGKAFAEENGIEMIVCLSYYYDDYGLEDDLETVVKHGCDALAVMNYDREDEIGQIETEAALCKTYGKRLVNIYELQEVGKYGLEEIHTYRTVGLAALKESSDRLLGHYAGQEIATALHEYRALKEMAGS